MGRWRAVGFLAYTGVLLVILGPQPVRPPEIVAGPVRADGFRSVSGDVVVADPVRVRIPALGVSSRLQRLGLLADGSVAVPDDPGTAGWWKDGPRPGEPGPAVILGHVDSRTGPGVFVALAGAGEGTTVLVDRRDGSTVTFRISGVSRVSKNEFPTGLVYAPTLDTTLRLVTCGGGFDRSRRSYRDNVIAYAEMAG
nr:class F sortase [Actinoplanes sp. OR16]